MPKKLTGIATDNAGRKRTTAQEATVRDQISNVKRDRDGFIRCRVCGCTEDDACVPEADVGCSWVEVDLCSVCDVVIEAMVQWFHDARRANFAALKREYERQAFGTPIPYKLTRKAGGTP